MIKQCALGTILCLFLAGCGSSSVIKDHRDDYKTVKANAQVLKYPEGSKPPVDKLYIPNEQRVGNLNDLSQPQIPSPPSLYHALTPIHIASLEGRYQLLVPAAQSVTENILTNFLTGLYGDGNPIRSNLDGIIETQRFTTSNEGKLASLWRSITRLPSDGIVFQFDLSFDPIGTKIDVRYRKESSDGVSSEWKSPSESQFAETSVVRLWGVLGKQLNDTTAFLSSQFKTNTTPLWVDHKGQFVLRLNDKTQNVETLISSAGLYLLSTSSNKLSLKPEEELPKIGDIVDLKIPFVDQDESKPSLIKGRRRNLDNIDWDEEIYTFRVDTNTLGKFLIIDFSDVDYPELRSYQVMSRFINPS
ncbi:hypothetical protein [Marinomonas algicola]|uniref:hypothetical protein n=1 Tax=Marinomonas algicola TaxID=2773454 RepID=UPI0017498DD3|nr:hypothetical protein [Marinomonas algicola]